MTQRSPLPQTIRFERLLTQTDFDRFAALSGDDNPIHVDPDFAARSKFGRTVAHGMLLYSLVCRAWGSLLPGQASLQWEQELRFPSPTFAGETVAVQLDINDLPAPGNVAYQTTLTRPNGETGCEGCGIVRLSQAGPLQFPPSEPYSSAAQTLETDPLTSYKGLSLGQSSVVRREFRLEDLSEYADLSGDRNPLYTDPEYAQGRGLPRPLIPAPMLAGMFSHLLGTQLPGRGTNWLKQRLTFPGPAFPGEEITARVEVTRLRPEKALVNLLTICTTSTQRVVCAGEALVLVQDVEG